MIKLGIIKGGQLGRMLAQAAVGFDLQIFVMDDDPQCPCRDLCHGFTSGDPLDLNDVYAFGRTMDVLTLEYEHVNAEALERLEAEGIAVRPCASVIELVQDKGRQKGFYRTMNIPTADFILTNGRSDLRAHADF